MNMGRRERGGILSLQKVKSLLERWFETKKDKKTGDLDDNVLTIEQGTVV